MHHAALRRRGDRLVREQLAANLGTAGDAGEEGWHSAQIGTPRWQVASVRVIRDGAPGWGD